MMHSHPDRWAYGGLLERIPWTGHPATFRTWNGTEKRAEPGDTLLVLRTGSPAVVVADVERREEEPEA